MNDTDFQRQLDTARQALLEAQAPSEDQHGVQFDPGEMRAVEAAATQEFEETARRAINDIDTRLDRLERHATQTNDRLQRLEDWRGVIMDALGRVRDTWAGIR